MAKSAFEAIDLCLQPHPDSRGCKQKLEIEILPASLVPQGQEMVVQQDGHCLAIPKKMLIMAYMYARQQFLDLRACDSPGTNTSQELSRFSYMMLLYDSEIIVATNFRRERLDEKQWPGQKNLRMAEIENELRLLDSLLTSPLHRHTKSPNLWSYRIWLLALYNTTVCSDTGHVFILEYRWPQQPSLTSKSGSNIDVWTRFLRAELQMIHEAGERHPRNYYAFVYARRLVEFLLPEIRKHHTQNDVVPHGDEKNMHVENQTAIRVLDQAVIAHHDWCLLHPSDCSGWSFLEFLLRKVTAFSGHDTSLGVITQTLERIVSLAWSGSSIWNFIKVTVSDDAFLNLKQRKSFVQQIQAISTAAAHAQASGTSGEALKKAAANSLVWIESNWIGAKSYHLV